MALAACRVAATTSLTAMVHHLFSVCMFTWYIDYVKAIRVHEGAVKGGVVACVVAER